MNTKRYEVKIRDCTVQTRSDKMFNKQVQYEYRRACANTNLPENKFFITKNKPKQNNDLIPRNKRAFKTMIRGQEHFNWPEIEDQVTLKALNGKSHVSLILSLLGEPG